MRAGDTVQVYVEEQFEKHGKWSAPKAVLSYDKPSGTLSVPGINGTKKKAAIEDVRTALPENSLAGNILKGIDVITNSIEDCIDELSEEPASSRDCTPNGHAITQAFDDIGLDNNDDEVRLTPLPSVGDEIKVY